MKEYLETVYIVFIPSENIHGTVENMGAYASEVKYLINDVEYIELMDNNDFIILDEIKIKHFEEEMSFDDLEENL